MTLEASRQPRPNNPAVVTVRGAETRRLSSVPEPPTWAPEKTRWRTDVVSHAARDPFRR